MAKHSFTVEERYAVYKTHGRRCYLCGDPVDMKTVEIDHVIPEVLLDEPAELARIMGEFDLPTSFDLNSYDNWMPACRTCNRAKSSTLLRRTPITQI